MNAFALARPPGVKHLQFQEEFLARYKKSGPVGTLPTNIMRNPSRSGNHASLKSGQKKDLKGSFREKLSNILRTVCSRGRLNNSSARGSVDGHLSVTPEMSSYSMRGDSEQQYDENESLGPVERQALMKLR